MAPGRKRGEPTKAAMPIRDVWAPELHFINNNYYITLSFYSTKNNTCILKSTSGKPEGPYVNAFSEDKPATGGIDASLFQDDDGSIYFTWGGGGNISKMKSDMSGFDGDRHAISYEKPTDGSWTRDSVAQEGASIFKHDGKYYLTGAAFYKRRYSSVAAISDNIYGPYKQWHEAVPCGGGTNYFKDKQGSWFCCYFGNDDESPFREKPGMIQIDFDADGKIIVAKHQPEFVLRP